MRGALPTGTLWAFENARYGTIHRLVVDRYACQRIRYIAKGRSLAVPAVTSGSRMRSRHPKKHAVADRRWAQSVWLAWRSITTWRGDGSPPPEGSAADIAGGSW